MREKTNLDLESLSIPEAITQLNKLYGENTVILASHAAGAKLRFISSGSYSLDFALGGGFPESRISEIRGPFSSFKSTIALKVIRNFQRKYDEGYGFYVDVEKAFDPLYAEKLGCDLDRLLVVNPDSGEQAVDVSTKVMRLSVPLLGIIDSIAALIPSAEIEGSMQDPFMGLQARLVNRAMRVITARMKRNLYDEEAPTTTVIALNQLREKIGVVYGNPETTPGGRGKEFAYSVIVRLAASSSKANVITEEVEVNGIKRSVRFGQRVDFRVLKNKCGGPQNEEGDFEYYEKPYNGYLANSFNNLNALFRYGVFFGAITYDGSGYGFEDVGAKNETFFVKKLKGEKMLQRKLYSKILAIMRKGGRGED